MNIQSAVKRSQWQESDRSPIRRMGQESTFLNNKNEQFRSATPLGNGGSARVDSQSILPRSPPTCNTFYRRLSLHALHPLKSCSCRSGSGHLLLQGVDHVEQKVYVVVRAEATRQVTEREYTVREASQRLVVSTYNLPPAFMPTG